MAQISNPIEHFFIHETVHHNGRLPKPGQNEKFTEAARPRLTHEPATGEKLTSRAQIALLLLQNAKLFTITFILRHPPSTLLPTAKRRSKREVRARK